MDSRLIIDRRPTRTRSVRRRAAAAAFAILLSAALVASGHAQTAPSANALTTFAGLRLRGEYWNWFDAPATNDEYAFMGGIARLGLKQDRANWSWLVEGAAPVLLGLPDDAVAPAPLGAAGLGANYRVASGAQTASVFLKQGFITMRLARDLKLRAGRFEFSDGGEGPVPDGVLGTLRRERIAERLIGPFGFSHIGRSFDGLELRQVGKSSGFTLMGARATQGVFNLDGMNEIPVDIGYAALTHAFTAGTGKVDTRLFALGYRDTRALPKVDNRPSTTRLRDSSEVQLLTLGGHIIALTTVGNAQADLLFWGALQTGDWGALNHSAFAYAAEAGLQWKVRHLDPWVRIGYTRSSGDDDPLDQQHGTFFQMLPTPRVYARFPFYNLMNSEDAFGELLLRPGKDWTIRSDVHVLGLTSAVDSWYAGGGAFERSSFGFSARPGRAHALARVIDTSIDFRVTPQLSFGAYVAHATPESEILQNYPGTTSGMLGLVEARWRR